MFLIDISSSTIAKTNSRKSGQHHHVSHINYLHELITLGHDVNLGESDCITLGLLLITLG